MTPSSAGRASACACPRLSTRPHRTATLQRTAICQCTVTLQHTAICHRTATHSNPRRDDRSEEHTSELQSRFDLVCRLLLEKKKYSSNTSHIRYKFY